jgi:predicted TIM-barrel fold metal-dependent hydrolase
MRARLLHIAAVLLAAPTLVEAQSPGSVASSTSPNIERLISHVVAGPVDSVHATMRDVLRQDEETRALPDLLRLLDDPRAPVRVRSGNAIAMIASERSVLPSSSAGALVRAMGDSASVLRSHASYALQAISPTAPGVTGVLRRALLTDPNVWVRRNAADAFVEFARGAAIPPDPELSEALWRALREDADVEVRQSAASALGLLGDPATLSVLAQALENSASGPPGNAEARAQIGASLISAIGEFGRAAIPTLTALAGNSVPEVRALAERELAAVRVLARGQPIIDVHRHGPTNAAFFIKRMNAEHVVIAVVSSQATDSASLQRLGGAEPRLIAGPVLPPIATAGALPEDVAWPDLRSLRREYEAGRLGVMGEVVYTYAGIPPTDARLEPYFALAEELEIPVAIHIGQGPPAAALPEATRATYKPEYGDPTLLEPILVRHPRLRLHLMHAANPPILQMTVAFLKAHPGVYVDMSPAMADTRAPARYQAALRAFRDAELLDRIMLGTDGTAVRDVIAVTAGMDFLTEPQKRGIYYDNAARFYRLDGTGVAGRARAVMKRPFR